MKSFKRILVLALAVVMCLTAFAISSSAAGEFNTEAQLLARYSENGNKIIVSITTKDKCGAMMATLNYPIDAGISLNKDKTGYFIEDGSNNDEYFDSSVDGQVKFAVVTNDVAVGSSGSSHWADFVFDVDVAEIKDNTVAAKAIVFELTEIQVCDIEETLANSVSVDSEKVEFSFKSLRSLGAQKRTDDALRFGTRADFEGGSKQNVTAANKITIEGETYTARRCGYTYGYTDKVSANDFADFRVELKDAKKGMDLQVVDPNALFVRTQKYYHYNPDENYFVYTLAIKVPSTTAKVSVRPYVVYEANEPKDDEDRFLVINGDVLTNSCDDIDKALAFIGDLGTNYYE